MSPTPGQAFKIGGNVRGHAAPEPSACGSPGRDGTWSRRSSRTHALGMREFLGLSGDWLPGADGMDPRTVRAWEQGKYKIPDGVRLEIERMEALTGANVTSAIEELKDLPEPAILTYRTDIEFRQAHPEVDWPASRLGGSCRAEGASAVDRVLGDRQLVGALMGRRMSP